MLDEKLLELITATAEMLGLEDPVIEKDYYVTQVIHALSAVENDYFRLGTLPTIFLIIFVFSCDYLLYITYIQFHFLLTTKV